MKIKSNANVQIKQSMIAIALLVAVTMVIAQTPRKNLEEMTPEEKQVLFKELLRHRGDRRTGPPLPPPPTNPPWKSGETIVTLTDSGRTLVVSGKGKMSGFHNYPPWHHVKPSIHKLIIEDGVTHIAGDVSFVGCPNLTSVTIPASVSSIGHIRYIDTIEVVADNPHYSSVDGVLFNKDKTELLQFPRNRRGEYKIPNSVTSIGRWAFFNTSLASVTLSNGITSIGTSMFADSPNLMSVTIPSGVTFIGDMAFSRCRNLSTIICLNPIPPQIREKTFERINNEACLYISSESIDAYRVADFWKDFKCIKPLEDAPRGEGN